MIDPITITREIVSAIRSNRQGVLVTCLAAQDTFRVKAIKADLIAEISNFPDNTLSAWVCKDTGMLIVDRGDA